jgi:hypothetical protein
MSAIPDFFRPTRLKIYLFFILLLMAFWSLMAANIQCDPYPCPIDIVSFVPIILNYPLFILMSIGPSPIVSVLFYICLFLYNYLLAAMIAAMVVFVQKRLTKSKA